ncbi:MAG: response regulator [Bacteroidales bacterium]|jgi:CheY-like chemotaxis protein
MGNFVDLTGKKILVVEDDDMNYVYLSQIFKLTKGEFFRARTGQEALEMAQSGTYHVILMDIQLPDISGNKVTAKIREFNKTTPIIAQTASRTPDEIDEALNAGCTEILVKPFTIDDFSKVMEKYNN